MVTKVLKYVLSLLHDVTLADEMGKSSNVQDTVLCTTSTLKKVSAATIKNCFKTTELISNNDDSAPDVIFEENGRNELNELLKNRH